MNAKSLATLVAAALLALLAALWTTSEQPAETVPLSRPLIPGLKQSINQLTALRVIKAGNQTVATLQRGEQTWTVAERGGYPADMAKLRTLLLGLANAMLLEEKTANPQLYPWIGVQDVNDQHAEGVRLEIEGLAKPLTLIIGNQDSQTGNGTYVRRPDEPQSWLVSGLLSAAKDTPQWLDQAVLDIAVGQVQQLTIRHPDGATLTIAKSQREQANFSVFEIPPDRQLQSENSANPLGGALAGLRLEDVIPVAQLNPAEHSGPEIEYRTFDGLLIKAKAFAVEDRRYAHFRAAFSPEQAQRFAVQGGTNPSDSELAERGKHAEQLDRRLSPWVYQIADVKYALMNKRMGDLLKPLASKEVQPNEEPVQEAEPGMEPEPAPAPDDAEPGQETAPTLEPELTPPPADAETGGDATAY